MKRVLVATAVLALTAVGAALAYHAVTQEREYRDLITRGDAALREDQTYGALEAYDGAIALRPESMFARLRRGETYRRRGDLERAARDFRAAADLDQTATRPLEELGDVMYQRQRYALAATAYERYVQLDDRTPRVAFKLALARYRGHELEGATAALDLALRQDDRMVEAHYLLGHILRDQGRLADACVPFERSVVLSPAFIPAREELADLYRALGRRAAEIDELQALAKLDPDHVARQIAVGLSQARANHIELAVLTLDRALGLAPDEPLIYEALGRIWLAAAQSHADRASLAKALEALERASSDPGAGSEILSLHGRALLLDGQTEAAARALRRAMERFPVDPAAFLCYADAADQLHDFEGARTALLQYSALVPTDPEFAAHARRIATLSLRLNDIGAAIEWLDRTAAARPDDVGILASLADAQARYGDYAAARATAARGIQKDPHHPQLLALAHRLR